MISFSFKNRQNFLGLSAIMVIAVFLGYAYFLNKPPANQNLWNEYINEKDFSISFIFSTFNLIGSVGANLFYFYIPNHSIVQCSEIIFFLLLLSEYSFLSLFVLRNSNDKMFIENAAVFLTLGLIFLCPTLYPYSPNVLSLMFSIPLLFFSFWYISAKDLAWRQRNRVVILVLLVIFNFLFATIIQLFIFIPIVIKLSVLSDDNKENTGLDYIEILLIGVSVLIPFAISFALGNMIFSASSDQRLSQEITNSIISFLTPSCFGIPQYVYAVDYYEYLYLDLSIMTIILRTIITVLQLGLCIYFTIFGLRKYNLRLPYLYQIIIGLALAALINALVSSQQDAPVNAAQDILSLSLMTSLIILVKKECGLFPIAEKFPPLLKSYIFTISLSFLCLFIISFGYVSVSNMAYVIDFSFKTNVISKGIL